MLSPDKSEGYLKKVSTELQVITIRERGRETSSLMSVEYMEPPGYYLLSTRTSSIHLNVGLCCSQGLPLSSDCNQLHIPLVRNEMRFLHLSVMSGSFEIFVTLRKSEGHVIKSSVCKQEETLSTYILQSTSVHYSC